MTTNNQPLRIAGINHELITKLNHLADERTRLLAEVYERGSKRTSCIICAEDSLVREINERQNN